MASEPGWDRLAQNLRDAGFEVSVTARPFTEERYGRIEQGVSRSIVFQVRDADGKYLGCVDVHDKYGRGGKWYGWTVWATGTDDLTVGKPTWAVTDRPQIVAHFRAAVAKLTEA